MAAKSFFYRALGYSRLLMAVVLELPDYPQVDEPSGKL
jgi:hypothetical protein